MSAKVADVMTRSVIAVRKNASFKELAVKLRDERISAFPVIDDDNRVIGVVSEADLIAKEATAGGYEDFTGPLVGLLHRHELEKARALTAGELMSKPPIIVRPDDTVSYAAQLMYDHRVKRLPVVDGAGRLAGIVSRTDVLSVFSRPDGEIRRQITHDVMLSRFLTNPQSYRITVKDGVVTLAGEPESDSIGHEIVRTVRHIEGVVAVRDRLDYRSDEPARHVQAAGLTGLGDLALEARWSRQKAPGRHATGRWRRCADPPGRTALRERSADVVSLRHVFQPASVAVVGASRRMGTAGRAILHNIVTAGYQGRVYAVNPHAAHMEAVPCVPSVAALPEPVDLAVVAVPPAAVCAVADKCGRRGIKALVVITVGLDIPQGADLLAICRRYGMRLVGPGCFGIAVPSTGLDATFAARHPAPGTVGLVMQSGGLGVALADRLSRLGVGVSSFASVGSKYDVSGNDMLMWWEQDQATKLAVLYIESFGNPRKFARTARRVGRTMPVLTVPAGRSVSRPARRRAPHRGGGHPPVTRAALFRQAGIIATDNLGELVDVAALLATQPLPAGPRVAIVSNVGGADVLAADACLRHGLTVHRLTGETRRRLHALVPPSGAVTGPVDTTATVSENSFRRCLELAAADEGVRRGPRAGPADRRHRRPGRGDPRRRRPGPPRRGRTRPARGRPAPVPRHPGRGGPAGPGTAGGSGGCHPFLRLSGGSRARPGPDGGLRRLAGPAHRSPP